MPGKILPATSLTGGGTGALDAIDGDLLADGDIAYVVIPSTLQFYIYSLDADSALAEDSPDIITPDSNAADKRWIRAKPFGVVNSSPASGERRIKDIRIDSSTKIKVVYDENAEP